MCPQVELLAHVRHIVLVGLVVLAQVGHGQSLPHVGPSLQELLVQVSVLESGVGVLVEFPDEVVHGISLVGLEQA